MKIAKSVFAKALDNAFAQLKAEDPDNANYRANLELRAGRWNYWNIHKVDIDGVVYYCSPCCKTANTDISRIKQVCARN